MSDSDEAPVTKKVTRPKKVVREDSSDDEAVVRKPAAAATKKKVAAVDSDSDNDAPVTKKKAAPKKQKQPADSSDDDDGGAVVRKSTKKTAGGGAAKKKVVDSDLDDEPVTTKKKPTAAAAAALDDDDDEPSAHHVDPNAALDDDDDDNDSAGRGGKKAAASSSAKLVDLIDYDNMTYDLFLAHLQSQTKAQRLDEKRILRERAAAAAAEEAADATDDCHFDGEPAYSYKVMLERVLATCRKNNPELSLHERIKLPMPKIERHGSKKTALVNFKELCAAVNRTQDELKDFIEKTLTTQGAIDGSNNLILKYQNAKVSAFEKLMVKYLNEYVTCHACGRIKTVLEKDTSSRLLQMKCLECGASRYIQTAGSATFKAQTTKRSKQRNAMV